MTRFDLAALAATASVVCIASGASAQGANVDVTVFPQASAGQTAPSRSGFLVCIGTSGDVDQYGTETTPASGVANQNFKNLPVGATVRVTVTKSGYTGIQLNTTLRADWNNHLQASMYPGTGGAVCQTPAATPAPASVPVQYDGRAIYPVAPRPPAPAPAPARLGEQTLQERGSVMVSSQKALLDCRAFGRDFVMSGFSGNAGQAIDKITLTCVQLNASGSVPTTNRVIRYSNTFGGKGGEPYSSNCATGQAVVGIRGTLDNGQVRAFGIQCKPLTNGLATPGTTANQIPLVAGIPDAEAWPNDTCGSGRPARALRIGYEQFRPFSLEPFNAAPWPAQLSTQIISMVQLICEQPPYW